MTADTTTRTQGRQLWPWLGILGFILGYFATWSIQFVISEDVLRPGGDVLLSALNTNVNEALWRLSSGLGYVSVACLIWFAAGLYRLLSVRAAGESILPAVIFGSFLVTCGALIIAWSFRAQVFDGLQYYVADPSSHVTMNRLSQDTPLSVWAGFIGASTATAVGGIRGTLFPRWFGWLSVVVAVLMVLLCLAGIPFPANVPAGIWLLVLSIWAAGQR